jgi:hypothetical protein
VVPLLEVATILTDFLPGTRISLLRLGIIELSYFWFSDYPPPDLRGRPLTPPPRYADPLPRMGSAEPSAQRYR